MGSCRAMSLAIRTMPPWGKDQLLRLAHAASQLHKPLGKRDQHLAIAF